MLRSSIILFLFKIQLSSLSHLKIKVGHVVRVRFLDQYGSMQQSRPEHQLDGGDDAHCWSILLDDQTLWISHLEDKLPLIPVIGAHISSAQHSNPCMMSSEAGIIISSLLSLIFESNRLTLPSSLLNFLTTFALSFFFQSESDISDFDMLISFSGRHNLTSLFKVHHLVVLESTSIRNTNILSW